MKKILFTLIAVTFINSLCFAQQESTAAKEPQKPAGSATAPVAVAPVSVPAPVLSKSITGKVETVSIGDLSKGIKPEIVVIGEDGQKLSLVVKPGTPIVAKDTKIITLTEIKKDDKVTVEYITKQSGTHRAESIKLVE
ncbi:MAG: hypothetical protein PHG87_07055 [Candidatus Omnitrophica bacterium]|nr:hypothetical protein [Candidatus Omnitrophota bacterium]